MATEKQIAANRRNAKKAGRKPGSFSQKTLDRIKVMEDWRQRTLKVNDILFDSQLSLARGAQYLFRIDKEWVKTGENAKGDKGFWRNKKPVVVTDPEEMRQYLEDEFCSGDVEDEHDPSAAYYFLSARDPMNQAIDSLMDRTHGKSKSELDVNLILPKPIYGGHAVKQLGAGQKRLPPKKVKVTVLPAQPRIIEHKE